eukprot:6193494-Pleurochrysis_carterae.AAC.2
MAISYVHGHGRLAAAWEAEAREHGSFETLHVCSLRIVHRAGVGVGVYALERRHELHDDKGVQRRGAGCEAAVGGAAAPA